MSTGVFITIELDSFKQDVLRGIYNCYDNIFCFPDCEKTDFFKLKYLFYELLQKTPVNDRLNFREPFLIEIPNINISIPNENKHIRKDPFSYCYMSNVARECLDYKIDKMVKYYVRNYYQTYDLDSSDNKETILKTMNKLNIDMKHFDRMIKEYSRYKSFVEMRKKRKTLSS